MGPTVVSRMIFGSPDQWATLRLVFPSAFHRVEACEAASGKTIHRTLERHPARRSRHALCGRDDASGRAGPGGRSGMAPLDPSRPVDAPCRRLRRPWRSAMTNLPRRLDIMTLPRSRPRRPHVERREIGMALLRHGQPSMPLSPRKQAPHGLAARIRRRLTFRQPLRPDAVMAATPKSGVRARLSIPGSQPSCWQISEVAPHVR